MVDISDMRTMLYLHIIVYYELHTQCHTWRIGMFLPMEHTWIIRTEKACWTRMVS